jgi:hypothetical protein
MKELLVNDELERTCKDLVMTNAGRGWGAHENPHDSRSPGQNSSQTPPEHLSKAVKMVKLSLCLTN